MQSQRRRLAEPVLFLFVSVGYTIGWTALSSLFANLKSKFGPAVLLQLNLAYFLPSLPLLYLQTQYGVAFAQAVGLVRSYAIQLSFGLGGAGFLSALHPYFTLSFRYLLTMTSLLGICCGVAFGSSYQLVSHFSQSCQTALTTGFVGSGPIVLFLEVAARMGPQLEQSQRILLYSVVASFSCIGLFSALLLIISNKQLLEHVQSEQEPIAADLEEGIELIPSQPDSFRSTRLGGLLNYRTNSPAWQPSNPPFEIESSSSEKPSADDSKPVLGACVSCESCVVAQALAREIWPAALALASNTACATLVFPFFPYVPSSGLLPRLLPQVIFFSRTVSDIIGRLIPSEWVGLTTAWSMHAMTAFKLTITPLIFWYITAAVPRSDITATLYVSVFWLQGGASNKGAYILANKMVSPDNRNRAGSFMAFIFQAACLFGLAVAFIIQHVMDPFKTEWS